MPRPFLQSGTVLWANGLPAQGIEVKLFDRDSTSSDDDLTTQVGRSNAAGEFSFWCDRARAIDTVPVTQSLRVWDFGDPWAHPPRAPGWTTKTVTVQVPDLNDGYEPYLQFRYQLFGQQRQFTANVQFGQNVYRLPDVGVGFRQNFDATGNGAGEFHALVHRQARTGRAPRLWVARQTEPDVLGSWKSIDGDLSADTPLAVARNADGRLEIFARSASGALVHCWQGNPTGDFGGWSSLDGELPPDAPIAAAANADGRLEVFVRGTDNAVWSRRQTAPNSGWGAWNSLAGAVPPGGDVVVATNGDGRLELFAHAPDGTIRHCWQRTPGGAWSDWAALAGGLLVTGPLAVARNQDGRLEVFAQGLDGAVWHNWQTAPNSGWSGWSSLGGLWIGNGLLAGSNRDGRIEVFAHGMDRNLYHAWQRTPNGGWSNWESLGCYVHPDSAGIPEFGYRAALGRWSNGALQAYQDTLASNQPVAVRGQVSSGWTAWDRLPQLEVMDAPPQRPPAPTLNSLAPGDGFLDVSWAAVAGATGYKVGYGTEQSAIYAGAADAGNATGVRLAPLSNGTRYWVSVRASNAAGESAFSNQLSATPNGPRSGIADTVLADAGTNPPTPSAYQAFSIYYTLTNRGNRPTGPFSLRIERDAGGDTAGTSIFNYGSLGPGESVSGTDYAPAMRGGAHFWNFFIGDRQVGDLARIT
ncbi:hypothetical protein ACFPOE_20870 [Caenimonas terrae]|uniref:Fibronectin type-III domain-containing protein n=1 Tax=Caenimonas terrae TaxID=696074 RepID=A0ABW0NK99_9BURK